MAAADSPPLGAAQKLPTAPILSQINLLPPTVSCDSEASLFEKHFGCPLCPKCGLAQD